MLSFFWVFSISSMLIFHMANTRNRVTTNNAENNGENNNNQDANPLPPPLPTLEQVLVMQAQML
jgi:subtilase family serine protease